MKIKDVEPKIKRLFPWALFLVMAAMFSLGAIKLAHGEDDIWACYGAARYEAMSSGWTPCNEMSGLCIRVREFLQTHTEAEARAIAEEKHIPAWIVHKAERCPK